MDNADPLAQLKDIHLPMPVSWWPLAPGWYVLSALILFIAIIFVHSIYKRHRHASAKKHALIILHQYQNQYEQENNASLTSAHISELLRRVALVYYPREQVASLRGEEWIDFLSKTSKGIDFYPIKSMLLDTPFRAMETMDLKPLFNMAQLWIKQRKVPCSN